MPTHRPQTNILPALSQANDLTTVESSLWQAETVHAVSRARQMQSCSRCFCNETSLGFLSSGIWAWTGMKQEQPQTIPYHYPQFQVDEALRLYMLQSLILNCYDLLDMVNCLVIWVRLGISHPSSPMIYQLITRCGQELCLAASLHCVDSCRRLSAQEQLWLSERGVHWKFRALFWLGADAHEWYACNADVIYASTEF